MARKGQAKKSTTTDSAGAPMAEVVHGSFTDHPLLVTLLAADVLPWQSGNRPEDPPIDSDRDQIVGELGEWLYRVTSGDPKAVSRELKGLAQLCEHIAQKKVVEQERMKTVSRHSKLSSESGVHPSLKSLKAEVRPGIQDRDDKTLRRNRQALGLPTLDEKSTTRIRETAEGLSAKGKKRLDPIELRVLLSSRSGKSVPKLPQMDAELIALCASLGARLEKRQLFTAFYKVLAGRDAGQVTDWAILTTLPAWARRDYDLDRRAAIRKYGRSIRLQVVEANECDRDDIRGEAPVQEVVNS